MLSKTTTRARALLRGVPTHIAVGVRDAAELEIGGVPLRAVEAHAADDERLAVWALGAGRHPVDVVPVAAAKEWLVVIARRRQRGGFVGRGNAGQRD